MAGLTVEPKLRPCYVVDNGKTQEALFHCWSFHSDIYSPSPLVGGHPGGVVARTRAIVELEDGSVVLIEPHLVKFVSGIFDEYAWDEEKESED